MGFLENHGRSFSGASVIGADNGKEKRNAEKVQLRRILSSFLEVHAES